MRFVKEIHPYPHIDAIAEEDDMVDIRVEERVVGKTLYVDVNGITVLRIGRLKKSIQLDAPIAELDDE